MRKMESAPRDGSHILVYAELASDRVDNAFNDWVFARWSSDEQRRELSPVVDDTVIDFAEGWLPTSVLR